MSAPAQKPRPAPVEHDRAHGVVGRSLLHGLADLRLHDAGPRVELVRPIERDGGHAPDNGVQNL